MHRDGPTWCNRLTSLPQCFRGFRRHVVLVMLGEYSARTKRPIRATALLVVDALAFAKPDRRQTPKADVNAARCSNDRESHVEPIIAARHTTSFQEPAEAK